MHYGKVGVHILPEEALVPLGSTECYSYSMWITLYSRETGWCSLIHRGYAEFDRCPGLWLLPDSNNIHLRVSSFTQKIGIYRSGQSLEIGKAVHVAIVVDGINHSIRLYIDNELDTEKVLPRDKKNDTFLPRRGPLYLGRVLWHTSSRFSLSRFSIFNSALDAARVNELFMNKCNHEENTQSTTIQNIRSSSTFNIKDESRNLYNKDEHVSLTSKNLTINDNETSAGGQIEGSDVGSDDHISVESSQIYDTLSVVESKVAPSINTSAYTVDRSRHLVQRQVERQIDLRELQKARKHGISYDSASGRKVFAHSDVMYVTDATGSRGITA